MKVVIKLLICFLLPWGVASAGEDDPLNNREFHSSLSETKNGVVKKKVVSDLVRFKNGKITSEFIREKFGFKWMRYRIVKDSAYTDETGTEVRLLEAQAVATNEANLTVMLEFSVLEWEIDGTVKVTKNDRLRRYYDMAGREKGGKPKKKKKVKRVFNFEDR